MSMEHEVVDRRRVEKVKLRGERKERRNERASVAQSCTRKRDLFCHSERGLEMGPAGMCTGDDRRKEERILQSDVVHAR